MIGKSSPLDTLLTPVTPAAKQVVVSASPLPAPVDADASNVESSPWGWLAASDDPSWGSFDVDGSDGDPPAFETAEEAVQTEESVLAYNATLQDQENQVTRAANAVMDGRILTQRGQEQKLSARNQSIKEAAAVQVRSNGWLPGAGDAGFDTGPQARPAVATAGSSAPASSGWLWASSGSSHLG